MTDALPGVSEQGADPRYRVPLTHDQATISSIDPTGVHDVPDHDVDDPFGDPSGDPSGDQANTYGAVVPEATLSAGAAWAAAGPTTPPDGTARSWQLDEAFTSISRSQRRRHNKPRSRKALVISLSLVGVLLVTGLGGALWFRSFMNGLDQNIERFGDPFAAIPEADRPATTRPGALNVLLLGSDSRISAGDPSQWTAGAQRTDAIMVAHLDADRTNAYVISIPRDSWVEVPGHGMNKINSAFSFGGPTLMVRTVEELTGVRIDHVVIADFQGFTRITDALGGVTINVARATHDEAGRFSAGPQLMDGETALKYVRQRHNLPGGDFDRVKRQQNWIRAVIRKLASKGTLTSPTKLTQSLEALTESVATDDGFHFDEIRDVAMSAREMDTSDVVFLTAPVKGTGRSPDGRQSIVRLDAEAGPPLWKSVSEDDVATWIETHRPEVLGERVR